MPCLPTIVPAVFGVLTMLACPSALVAAESSAAVGPSGRAVESKAETTGSTSESAYARERPLNNAHADDPATPENRSRRLRLSTSPSASLQHPAADRSADLLEGFADSSVVTAVAALAFVAGLFIVFAWIVKRGMPASSQVIPAEAVRILGRVPLGARQYGNLLQLGGKLVLVHVTTAGVEKIAEIDNPQEVQKVIALCSKNAKGSSQQEFEEVFGKFAAEQTAGGFLGDEAKTTSGGRYA